MNCPLQNNSMADLLIDYCAGTLDEVKTAQVEAHVGDCAECRKVVDAQRSAWTLLDEWTAPAVSTNFDERLYRRIEAEQSRSWWSRTWQAIRNPGFSGLQHSWKPAIPLAAVTVVVAAGFLLRGPSASPDVKAVQPAAEAVSSSAQSVDVDKLDRLLEDLDMLTPIRTSTGG
ncbi:MAG: zf-HC2 domain-containing protein [Bryobacteraceae bacterium]